MSQLPSLQPSSTYWVVSLQTLLCQHLLIRCHGNQRPQKMLSNNLKMLYKVCKQKDALELQGFEKSITWLRTKDYLCTFWKNGSLHLQSSELGGSQSAAKKLMCTFSGIFWVAAGCCGPGDVADPVTEWAHHLLQWLQRGLCGTLTRERPWHSDVYIPFTAFNRCHKYKFYKAL